MNKNSAVLWDWNGTLINDAFLFVDIMNFFLKEHNLKQITVNDYRKFFQFPIKNYYLSLGFNFKIESFESLGVRFIEEYKKRMFEAPLFGGVLSLLAFLKKQNFKQFVVSAQESLLLKQSVKHYGLDSFFIDFVGVPNFFAKGKESLALSLVDAHLNSPYNVFVVGDTLHDLEVARSIGATPILVSYGHCNKKRLSLTNEVVVDSVEDLFGFFASL